MNIFLLAILLVGTLSTPALAARIVHLKDGGVIKAISVWRSHGRVYVLVNRDTLTDFSSAEIDLKRTFPRTHRIAKKKEHGAAGSDEPAAQPAGASPQDSGKTDNATKSTSLLSKLPTLPDKKPESRVPPGGTSGTIRQHKKEMTEKASE